MGLPECPDDGRCEDVADQEVQVALVDVHVHILPTRGRGAAFFTAAEKGSTTSRHKRPKSLPHWRMLAAVSVCLVSTLWFTSPLVVQYM